MLDFIREGARSWIAQIFVVFIALTFVGAAFFVWGDVQPNNNIVAVAAGEEIGQREFRDAADRVESQLRSQFGDNVDPSLIASLNPARIALDNLINNALQEKAAADAGFDVTAEELTGAIQAMGEFQVEGVFDPNRYFNLLALNGIAPADFERQMRRDLIITKLRRTVERVASITPGEIETRYLYENQPISVRYTKIPGGAYETAAAVTDAAVTDYFEKNQPRYLEAEVRSFRTLTINSSSFASEVTTTPEEEQEYFETNIDTFVTEETVSARHIIIQVAQEGGKGAEEEARKKIAAAHERLKKGEDFSAVARAVSEGPSAPKGGDLGAFTRGMMVPPFEKVVFALKPGEISDPFQTPFGWHIATVYDRREAQTPTFDQAREKVLGMLRDLKMRDMAKAFMEKVSATVAPENFAAITDENPRIQVNSYTVRKGAITPNLDYPRILEEEVFRLQEKQVSPVIEVPAGFAIVLIDTVIPPATPPLDKVRERVVQDFRSDFSRKKVDDVALDIERRVNEGADFEEVAKEHGLTVQVTAPFSRASFGEPGRSREDGALMEAFELGDDEAKSVPVQGDHLVIMVASRHPIDNTVDEKKLASVKATLRREKGSRAYTEFVNALRKKAEESGEVKIRVKLN